MLLHNSSNIKMKALFVMLASNQQGGGIRVESSSTANSSTGFKYIRGHIKSDGVFMLCMFLVLFY